MSFFSFYRAPISNSTPCRAISLGDAFNYITSDYATERTAYLRNLASADERKKYKSTHLDYVTFSGTFAYRSSNGVLRHSGYICFDIDHIGDIESINRHKTALSTDEQLGVCLMFRSPSGDGLKVVIDVGSNMFEQPTQAEMVARHREVYKQIGRIIELRHGLKCDKTSDITRSCFLCHDDDCYIAEDAHFDPSLLATVPVEETFTPVPMASKANSYIPTSDWQRVDDTISRIEAAGVDVTAEYHDWMRIGFALSNTFGESGRDFFHRISRFHPNYRYSDANRQYDHCLRSPNGNISLGTLFYLTNCY